MLHIYIAHFHLHFIFFFLLLIFIDQLINGNTTTGLLPEDYTQHHRRSPSPNEVNTGHQAALDRARGLHHERSHERSRSRSPRGYLSVRRSPELLRESARSVSPSREAIQAAAREAAEQAIHLADSEDRKSPIDHHATGNFLNATFDLGVK